MTADRSIPAGHGRMHRRRGARGGRPRAAQRACSPRGRRWPRSSRSSPTQLVDGRTCVAVNSGTSGLHLGLLAAGVGPGRRGRSSRRSPSPRPPTRWRSPARRRCSPTSSRTTSASTPPPSRPPSPSAPSAIMPVHLYGHPADMDRPAGESPSGTACRSSRTPPRRTAPRWHGRPVGTFGAFAHVQPLPDQEHDLRRGRHGRCADRRGRPHGPAAAQPGHGAPLRERGRRLQHPDDRRPRRHRPRAADQAGRLDRAAPGERRLPRRPPARASSSRRSPTGADARLPPVHDPGAARTATASPRALRDEHGVGTGVYYPIPNHRLPSFGLALDLPETERAAREVLSLPVHPSLTQRRPASASSRGQRRRQGGSPDGATLRAGLIGLGMMGRHHARVLRALDGVELVARRRPRRRPAPRGRRPAACSASVEELIAGRHRLLRGRRPDGLPRARSAWRWPRPASTPWSRSRWRRTSRRRPPPRRGVRARGLVGAVGHIERYNPALQQPAAAARARRARRGLPDRHPPAGPVPGPDRRRRRGQGPRHARHRPDRVGGAQQRSASVAARTALQERPRARGPGRRRRQPRRRHRHQPPGELAVADEGAGHDRHRRARARSSPTPSPPT